MLNKLMTAIKNQDVEEIKNLLLTTAIDLNQEVVDSEEVMFDFYVPPVPLHLAAFIGNGEIVDLLIQHGAKLNLKGGPLELTPLHNIIISRNPKIDTQTRINMIYLLLGMGATLTQEMLNHCCDIHMSLLNTNNQEALTENYAILQLLCHHHIVTQELLHAIRNNKIETVTEILTTKYKLFNTFTSFQVDLDYDPGLHGLALFHASVFSNSNMLKLLLEKGANLKKVNYAQRNVFHYIACCNREQNLRWFLNHIADYSVKEDLLNAPDWDGNTSLHYGASKGSFSIVKLLLEHGANPDIVNNNGNTPQALTTDPSKRTLLRMYPNGGRVPKLTWLCAKAAANMPSKNMLKPLEALNIPEETKELILTAKKIN